MRVDERLLLTLGVHLDGHRRLQELLHRVADREHVVGADALGRRGEQAVVEEAMNLRRDRRRRAGREHQGRSRTAQCFIGRLLPRGTPLEGPLRSSSSVPSGKANFRLPALLPRTVRGSRPPGPENRRLRARPAAHCIPEASAAAHRAAPLGWKRAAASVRGHLGVSCRARPPGTPTQARPAPGRRRGRCANRAGRRARRTVEIDRVGVPVEHRPFEPAAIARDGERGKARSNAAARTPAGGSAGRTNRSSSQMPRRPRNVE